jgi:uncharacterized RDD family membrane protein YckC
MGAMQCPRCGRIHHESAVVCECGHAFAAAASGAGAPPPPFAPPPPAGAAVPPPPGASLVAYSQLASLGDRFLGQVLDTCILFGIVLVALGSFLFMPDLGIVSSGLGWLAAIFYMLFADGFPGGQSIGKRVLGTAVVDASTGRPCTWGQSFLRNLLLWLLGFIDWLFIFGGRHQRLGDRAANTLVVKIGR